MYHDGWMASAVPVCPPWDPFCKNPNALRPWSDSTKWELYNVASDWTQYDDVAAQYPDKLRELQQLFVAEAGKYNVFPLNADKPAMAFSQRPGLKAGQTRFVYDSSIVNLTAALAPNLLNISYTISADVTVGPKAEGVIMQQGGHFGGYALAVKDGRPFFAYNVLALSTTSGLRRRRWPPAGIRSSSRSRPTVGSGRAEPARCSSTARPSRASGWKSRSPCSCPSTRASRCCTAT